MDLSEVIDAYLVESDEFLREMETILLRTESTEPTDEDLNAIFRAVHTIKGTAGMFGFESTVGFSHVLENLLEDLRSKSIPFQKELTEKLLIAKDFLSFLVAEEHKGKLSEEKKKEGNLILEQFKPFLNISKDISNKEKVSNETNLNNLSSLPVDGMNGTSLNSDIYKTAHYLISFRPHRNVFSQGLDPYAFIGYLKKIGKIIHLKTITEEIPKESEFNPELCYLGFEINFLSDKDVSQVQKVFEFIENDAFVHILPPHSTIESLVDVSRQLPEEEIFLGSIWKEIGILDPAGYLEYLEYLKTEKTGIKLSESSLESNFVSASEKPIPESESFEKRAEFQKSSTIKVDSKRIDNLINRVGELVVASANMNQLIGNLEDSNLQESSLLAMRLLNEVREISLKLRMVPIGDIFQKYQRTVRDLGKELGKEIRLITEGNETELDRNIVDKLGDPLTHLVRNACDHGIESSEERIKLGKPKTGTLFLRAYQEAGSIVIRIQDDGKGIQKEKVWAKAIEKGIVSGPIPDSEEDVFALLFHPGLSTADKVTNVSGRGVGLDVVQKNIEHLRGNITVKSTLNKGSEFIIRLPLTLAIIDGFW